MLRKKHFLRSLPAIHLATSEAVSSRHSRTPCHPFTLSAAHVHPPVTLVWNRSGLNVNLQEAGARGRVTVAIESGGGVKNTAVAKMSACFCKASVFFSAVLEARFN